MPWKLQLHRRSSSFIPKPISDSQPLLSTTTTPSTPSDTNPSNPMAVVASPMRQWTAHDVLSDPGRLHQPPSSTFGLASPSSSSTYRSSVDGEGGGREQKKQRRRSLLASLGMPLKSTLSSKGSTPSDELTQSASMSRTYSHGLPRSPAMMSTTRSPPPARPEPISIKPTSPTIPNLSDLPKSPIARSPSFRKPVPQLYATTIPSSSSPTSGSLLALSDSAPNSSGLPSSPIDTVMSTTSPIEPQHIRTLPTTEEEVTSIQPSRVPIDHSLASTRTSVTIRNDPNVSNSSYDSSYTTTDSSATVTSQLELEDPTLLATVRNGIPPMWKHYDGVNRGKSQSVDISRPIIMQRSQTEIPLKRNKTVIVTAKDRGADDEIAASETQRLRNVWRARKMAQVFGSEPPKELLQSYEDKLPSYPSSFWSEELASSSPLTSPTSSNLVTPSTSLDFGRSSTDAIPTAGMGVEDSGEHEYYDTEKSDFRIRRLRAQKLTRFFGAPPPASKESAAPPPVITSISGVPPPLPKIETNVAKSSLDFSPTSTERPDTVTPDRFSSESTSEERLLSKKIKPHATPRTVDEWDMDEMQEVMAKLRKLR